MFNSKLKTVQPSELTKEVKRRIISGKRFNKIFCIGYNKTGTTSMKAILKQYGFELPNQQDQEARLVEQTFATDYTEFNRFISQYDAFQDLPFSQGLSFVAADVLFPDSKFVLTTRDTDEWFRSLATFHEKKFGIDTSNFSEKQAREKFDYLFPGYMYSRAKNMISSESVSKKSISWEKLYDKNFRTEIYERRNEQIQKYFFERPDKLLVIDVTKEKTTEKICRFLNIPLEYVTPMPHENKT